jgi:phenol 2-monooxygenase
MGVGMNVSMQDTYNLVWKLGHVLKGIARPNVLKTYTQERHATAQQLIDMDQKMSEFYSQGPGKDAMEYSHFRDQFRTFISGVGVEYEPSTLTHGSLQLSRNYSGRSRASKIVVGSRLPSHLVMNQAEANLTHVHSLLQSDGRWRLLVLAGDISLPSQMQRLRRMCEHLASELSFLRKYTPAEQKPDSVIDVLTIHAAQRENIEFLDLPEILRPFDPELGYDYWKVFTTRISGEEGVLSNAYTKWEADQSNGNLVVVRPDQHVSLMCSLDGLKMVEDFFDNFMVLQESYKKTKRNKSN